MHYTHVLRFSVVAASAETGYLSLLGEAAHTVLKNKDNPYGIEMLIWTGRCENSKVQEDEC